MFFFLLLRRYCIPSTLSRALQKPFLTFKGISCFSSGTPMLHCQRTTKGVPKTIFDIYRYQTARLHQHHTVNTMQCHDCIHPHTQQLPCSPSIGTLILHPQRTTKGVPKTVFDIYRYQTARLHQHHTVNLIKCHSTIHPHTQQLPCSATNRNTHIASPAHYQGRPKNLF